MTDSNIIDLVNGNIDSMGTLFSGVISGGIRNDIVLICVVMIGIGLMLLGFSYIKSVLGW